MDWKSDLRVALRQLRSAWTYTGTALAILALGIGAGTAIFTVVNAVLLRPLPYDDADRIVSVCETNPSVEPYCVASPPNVQDWADATTRFEAIGFAREWPFALRQDGRTSQINGGYATPGWLRALRASTAVGRTFEPDDLERGDRVALLAHDVWMARFGGDPNVVGRSVTLDGEPHTVVGVLSGSFVPADLGAVGVWTLPPWDPRDESRRGWRGFVVAARLADGADIDQARAELESLRFALEARHPETNAGWGIRVRPLHETVTGSMRPVFLVFVGAVALLLLVACANLANLALVRATSRRRELAVRAAIGGGRLALIRLLLTESMLLSLAGGLAGFGLAALMTRTIIRLAPAGIPRVDEAVVDLSAFGVALALAVVTAVAVGLLPALRASRVDLARVLREGMGAGRSHATKRARRALVAGEIALTLMLLVGAGLLVRSFYSLLDWDPGFERENLLTISAFAPSERYTNTDQVGALWVRLENEIASLPGITSVATVSAGPVFGGIERDRFVTVGDVPPADPPNVRWYDASPDYFATLGVPIVQGRPFDETDARGDPSVAVINQALATRWFPGRDPLGRHIRLVASELDLEIVGVAADIAPFEAGQPVQPQVWWSDRQHPRWGTFLVVRSEIDPAALSQSIRTRIDNVDAEIQTGTPTTLSGLIDRRLVAPRFNLFLVGALALIALVLAAAGVYGVVAHIVSTRRREIGIRLALGEGRRAVTTRMVSEGAITALTGLAIGTAGGLLFSRFLESLLYGVTASDPATYVLTTLSLLLVSLLACAGPAVRAGRTDPAIILREE